MNESLPIEKIFEMYGRVSLERDLLRERIEKLITDETRKPSKEERNEQ